MLCHMNSPETPAALPLEYATELAMELHLLRGECSDAAQGMAEESPVDEVGLEECAVLDEALANAQRVLHAALARIKEMRSKK